MLFALQDLPAGGAPGPRGRVGLRGHRGRRRPDVDAQLGAAASTRSACSWRSSSAACRCSSTSTRSRYMGGDRGYTRFFAYLNFFVFSMLAARPGGQLLPAHRRVGVRRRGVVPADLVLVPARRPRRRAGIKAFVINVLGDVGLVLGTYFIFQGTGTLDFLGTFERRRRGRRRRDLTAGCILLLVGAFAKSAQVPLHTWLADAMEGPTPVSALIHAATMVTAGVYLIARMWPLFEEAPAAADVGAIIGCLTLLVAGDDRARRHRPQARHRLLDDVADRLHGHGASASGAYVAGPVPPHDARVLQGAALHGGRLGHRRDGRRAEPRPDGRLPQADAVHVRLHRHRRPRARRRAAVLGLLLQGRDPRLHRRRAATGTSCSPSSATSSRS